MPIAALAGDAIGGDAQEVVITKPGMKPAMNNPAMDVFATTP
ncbi:MAG: hypothetical protein ACLSAH_23840 [Bilophila wadsworthia]